MANLSRNLRWQSVYGSKFISGIVVKKKKTFVFLRKPAFWKLWDWKQQVLVGMRLP